MEEAHFDPYNKEVDDLWAPLEKEIKEKAPLATVIPCEKEYPDRPSQYKQREFHSDMTRSEADILLSKASYGTYFVRKSNTLPGRHVLSLRLNNSLVKHYTLSHKNGMHIVGDKEFGNLEDLVNAIVECEHLNAYVDDFAAIHQKRASLERHEIPRDDCEILPPPPAFANEDDSTAIHPKRIPSDDCGIPPGTESEQDSFRQSSSSDQNGGKVPLEILARGSLIQHAYHRALEEGKTTVKRVPMMFIGQGQAGKTSLKKSLIGEKFDPYERSTAGIEADPSYCNVSTEVWKVGERSEEESSNALPFSYEHSTAQYILDRLKRERKERNSEDMTLCAAVSHDNLYSAQGEAGKGDISEVPKTSSKPDVSEISRMQSQQVPEEVSTLIEKLLKMDDSKKDDDRIYSVLWDFGGQSVYYVTHSMFLTVRAIYFLVYNLSWDPDEVASHRVRQGVFNIQDGFCDKTNKDYLDFWMSSVSTLVSQDEVVQGAATSTTSERMPLVFLVCTHADKAYKNKDPEEIAQELFSSLKAECYGEHLQGYFVVDNTKSGGEEKECAGVTRLREEVHNVVKNLPQMKEALPIKWLKYEKALQGMLQDEVKWIYYDEAWRIAKEECGILSEDQFQVLLTFLHDQRSLIHFDDTPDLKKIVILDPQWLIDIFKKVIAIKPSEKKGKKFEELWLKLETTGILDERLLQHVWRPFFDVNETSSSLVALMKKFCLLCPWPSSSDKNLSKEYLVPSMLMFPPKEDINQLIASSGIPSLFVKFASGRVPPGLFPRLVLDIFQWFTDYFRSKVQPKLHQNFARFFIDPEQGCSVILLCRSSFVEVVVHKKTIKSFGETNYDDFQVAVAKKVCCKLGLILECMRGEFHWLKNMAYEMSVCCPVCCTREFASHCCNHNVRRCKEEKCLHFWSESELRDVQEPLLCTRSGVVDDYRVPVARMGVWFRKQQDVEGLGSTADVYLGNMIEGVDEQALVLPNEVLLEKSDANHVIAKVQENLSLEHKALIEPDSETKRQIRCLCLRAKSLGRLDVVERLREIAPAGTTGPLLPEARDVATIPARQRQNLTIHLCGGNEWKLLAERLGLSLMEILFFDKRLLNPCEAALGYARERGYIHSVGELYDMLVECGFPMLADLL
ncbi:uncharacterized protein LOC111327511 isoform X2 [Stylophora pistillata]|uniref:uncharacterized protein LOC111327511 isoform X2 n=1 Tax=Stylophora pistillata TaxID=50429 RepID=UPI000C03DC40|nr:uncharacterized protein LOC111327511 isoform X2 [Stylophora pistillata]